MRLKVLFLALTSLLILDSCRSSKNIEVRDSSTIASSRKEFFDNLYSSMKSKTEGINSYYSRKLSVASEGIPLYNSLNAQLYMTSDNHIVSKVYLPFPVMEVAKVKIDNGSLTFDSKPLGKNGSFDCPSKFVASIRAAFLGCVPDVYTYFGESDFSKFTLYILNDRYVLYRKSSQFEVNIVINSDYTLHSLSSVGNDINLNFSCDNYELTDGFTIPKNIVISSLLNNAQYEAKISIKNIVLNGNSKIEY